MLHEASDIETVIMQNDRTGSYILTLQNSPLLQSRDNNTLAFMAYFHTFHKSDGTTF